jgi:hypothetical protein
MMMVRGKGSPWLGFQHIAGEVASQEGDGGGFQWSSEVMEGSMRCVWTRGS